MWEYVIVTLVLMVAMLMGFAIRKLIRDKEPLVSGASVATRKTPTRDPSRFKQIATLTFEELAGSRLGFILPRQDHNGQLLVGIMAYQPNSDDRYIAIWRLKSNFNGWQKLLPWTTLPRGVSVDLLARHAKIVYWNDTEFKIQGYAAGELNNENTVAATNIEFLRMIDQDTLYYRNDTGLHRYTVSTSTTTTIDSDCLFFHFNHPYILSLSATTMTVYKWQDSWTSWKTWTLPTDHSFTKGYISKTARYVWLESLKDSQRYLTDVRLDWKTDNYRQNTQNIVGERHRSVMFDRQDAVAMCDGNQLQWFNFHRAVNQGERIISTEGMINDKFSLEGCQLQYDAKEMFALLLATQHESMQFAAVHVLVRQGVN
jgi:hypothetical protein